MENEKCAADDCKYIRYFHISDDISHRQANEIAHSTCQYMIMKIWKFQSISGIKNMLRSIPLPFRQFSLKMKFVFFCMAPNETGRKKKPNPIN